MRQSDRNSLQAVRLRLSALILLLLSCAGSSAYALFNPHTRFIYPKPFPGELPNYIGEALVYTDTLPVTMQWYSGPTDIVWQSGDPLPENLELIKEGTFTESNSTEADNAVYSRLEGFIIDEPRAFWVVIKNQSNTHIGYSGPFEPLSVLNWTFKQANYSPGSLVGGETYGSGPMIWLDYRGRIDATFYQGESGDTSIKLGTASAKYADPLKTSYVVMPQITLTETIQVWVRLISSDAIVDTPSVTFNVTEPTQSLHFINWYGNISSLNAGATVDLVAKVNAHSSEVSLEWFWGESGDLSNPIPSMTLPDGREFPFVRVVVPAENTAFWVRASTSAGYIDSPTAYIQPMPLTTPRILDQPNDYYKAGNVSSAKFSVVATGGYLNYDWYIGDVGNTSVHLPITPGVDGSTSNVTAQFPTGQSKAWVRISNEMGTVDSRQIYLRSISSENLIFETCHLIYRLRSQEATSFTFASFPHKFNASIQDLVLSRKDGDSWQYIDTGRSVKLGFDTPGGLDFFYPSNIDIKALPSGTYQLSVGIGAESITSGEITFINEASDGSERKKFAGVLQTPGVMTEGGLYRAWIHLPYTYLGQSLQVYAGALGDRSTPIPSDARFSYTGRDYDRISGEDIRRDVFDLEWKPTEADTYWLEAELEEGGYVSLYIKFPDDFAWDESILSGEETLNIILPEGVDIIPLPRPPEAPEWFIGGSEEDTVAANIPFLLSDVSRADMALSTGLNENSSSPKKVKIVINIDELTPPLLSNAPSKLAVDWNGRAVWAGKVAGDILNTRVLTGTDSDNLTSESTYPLSATRGFTVPETDTYARVEWNSETATQTFEAPVVHLPQSLSNTLEIESFWEDNFLTLRLGSFLSASNYPWLFHTEMGWWCVFPVGEGFHFYAKTHGTDFTWNWSNAAIFPYIYNYSTKSWKYYLPNSHGWYYDFTLSEWAFIGL
jgi:hypothetical protein